MPGFGEPDRVDHPARHLGDARRRVALARLGRDRLRDERRARPRSHRHAGRAARERDRACPTRSAPDARARQRRRGRSRAGSSRRASTTGPSRQRRFQPPSSSTAQPWHDAVAAGHRRLQRDLAGDAAPRRPRRHGAHEPAGPAASTELASPSQVDQLGDALAARSRTWRSAAGTSVGSRRLRRRCGTRDAARRRGSAAADAEEDASRRCRRRPAASTRARPPSRSKPRPSGASTSSSRPRARARRRRVRRVDEERRRAVRPPRTARQRARQERGAVERRAPCANVPGGPTVDVAVDATRARLPARRARRRAATRLVTRRARVDSLPGAAPAAASGRPSRPGRSPARRRDAPDSVVMHGMRA